MNYQSTEMTEQELLNDLLIQEKEIAKNYTTFITETSCPNMRQVLTDNLNCSLQKQYEVFNIMNNKGWYQTKDAQDQDVQQAKQKFQQLNQQIS